MMIFCLAAKFSIFFQIVVVCLQIYSDISNLKNFILWSKFLADYFWLFFYDLNLHFMNILRTGQIRMKQISVV